MTAPRHRRIAMVLAVLSGAGFACGQLTPAPAATTGQVVVDPINGVAISGFDPVAYFAKSEPTQGRREFESTFAGAVWRFHNEGNRAAFVDSPYTYMPRYGGFDPVGLARGVPLAGNPELWWMQGQRLYLFFTAQNRDAFILDAEHIQVQADRGWPAVRDTLAP
jgi:hypothetical protein